MMAVGGKQSPYPDPWVDDGKVWCYYDVTTTESATSLLYSTGAFSAMEVDGVSKTLANSYTFDSTGEHLVKFTLANSKAIGGTSGSSPQAFRERTGLVRCYIPETVETLGRLTFSGATNVTFVRLSTQIKVIGQQALYNCRNLALDDIYLPNLTTLDSGAFNNCQKIKKISNLGSITTVPNSAIRGMSALTDLVLPATLTTLADASIYGDGALKRVTCHAITPPSKNANVFNGSTLASIKVPSGSVNDYKTSWSSYANIITAI